MAADRCRLAPGDRLIVAVSGGPDSMCLLDLLARLGYPLVAAHLDHGLRPESAAEGAHVQAFAESLGVHVVFGRREVRPFAAEQGLSVEEAARELRYRFLFEVAESQDAAAVAVGHTADDQVETLLLNLLRGAGLRGLSAMRPRVILEHFSAERALVRPLLEIWREEVARYCEQRGIETVVDRTNLDPAFTRNRVRHELIPQLETFNPRVRQALWRLAASAEGERTLAKSALTDLKKDLVVEAGPDFAGLDLPGLQALPEAVALALLHHLLRGLRGAAGQVSYKMVRRAMSYALGAGPAEPVHLGQDLVLLTEEGVLWAYRRGTSPPAGDWPQLSGEPVLRLEVPGRVSLVSGWTISASRSLPEGGVERVLGGRAEEDTAWLDAAAVTGPLFVRGRRPGDRFRPLGLGGQSQKLSDFMINERMPLRARPRWPLVVCGEEIVWVAGLRVSHPFRLKEETREALRLHLHRPGP